MKTECYLIVWNELWGLQRGGRAVWTRKMEGVRSEQCQSDHKPDGHYV